MGAAVSYVWNSIPSLSSSGKQTKLVLCGLDAAGRETILTQLKLGPEFQRRSEKLLENSGYPVSIIESPQIKITAFYLGLSYRSLRVLVEHLIKDADAIVYIIDSHDTDRLEHARSELHAMLKGPYHLQEDKNPPHNVPLLIFANKQDLRGAQSPTDIQTFLKMEEVYKQGEGKWFVQGSVAANGGRGIREGFTWLSSNLSLPGLLPPEFSAC
jgi:GTPase SAR1 family protein